MATQSSDWMMGEQGEEVEDRTVAPDETIVFRQLRERNKARLLPSFLSLHKKEGVNDIRRSAPRLF